MPKQLNVNLAFTADTSQAKQQLQQLQQQLTQLTSGNFSSAKTSFHLTQELKTATDTAAKLKMTLQEATNASTGKLDLTKFKQSMDASHMSIEKYKADLLSLGPEGQQAFASLAGAITQAEIPMRRTHALFKEFGVTLMNAARWQFSSSVLHGMMSAVQGAYNYAQDLDKSLTDIAIVTGRSTDQMAEFAEQANKSAQALSVSTTGYTDAALIYYQQGLSDKEVQARTDTTMKLSNVTGQSAEEVSSYMTAIWNNFAEGSDNLEHFADAITALGAHTASSSAEIAKGMQQFASVADTVGLSYENAAAALATIVAKTRQSESSVGNGLRTIFARLDSLKMGETLEDGVGLTKYTEALAKAGVEVLDQNGKLKDMDTILYDIGERWQTLDNTQKATLANTVGGVRQYSNLMALFDDFDKFKENAEIARNSDGSLQKQQEIYAEGWEAAGKRVKAAWQAIYSDLIDEKFFIGLLNGFESVLKVVDNFIDAIGGVKGILSALGTLAFTVFQDKMAKGIEAVIFNFQMMTKAGRDYYQNIKTEQNEALVNSFSETGSFNKDTVGQAYAQQGILNNEYLSNAEKMSDFERKIAQIKLDQQRTMIDNIKLQAEENEKLGEKIDLEERSIIKDAYRYNAQQTDSDKKIDIETNISGPLSELRELSEAEGAMDVALNTLSKIKIDPDNTKSIEEARQEILAVINTLGKDGTDALSHFSTETQDAITSMQTLAEEGTLTKEDFKELYDQLEQAVMSSDKSANSWNILQETLTQMYGSSEKASEKIAALREDFEQNGMSVEMLAQKYGFLVDFTKKVGESFAQTGVKILTTSQSIAAIGGQIMSVSMIINQLQNLINIANDKELSGWEKFVRVLSVLGMLIPTLTRLINTNNAVVWRSVAGRTALWLIEKKELKTKEAEAFMSGVNTIKTKLENAAKGEGVVVTNQLAASNMTLGSSLSFLLPYIVGIAAAITTIVLVYKGLDAVIYSANERLADANKELEEAEKVLSETSEAAKDANEEFKNLSETLEGWTKKRKGIDELTKGTLEFKQAVIDANTELLSTLDNLGMLDKVDLKYDENRVAYLDEEDSEKVMRESFNRALTASVGRTIASLNVEQKKVTATVAQGLKDIKESAIVTTQADQLSGSNVNQSTGGANIEWVKYGGNYFTGKEDSEILASVENWANTLYENGFTSDDVLALTENEIDKLVQQNEDQLGFLSNLRDVTKNQDIIEAIANVIDAIHGKNVTEDEYVGQLGEQALINADVNTELIPSSLWDDFAQDAGKKILGGEDFLEQLKNFDLETNSEKNLDFLADYAERHGIYYYPPTDATAPLSEGTWTDKDQNKIEKEWQAVKTDVLANNIVSKDNVDSTFADSILDDYREKITSKILNKSPEISESSSILDLLQNADDVHLRVLYETANNSGETDPILYAKELMQAWKDFDQQEAYNKELETARAAGFDIEEWTEYVNYLQAANEKLAENKVLAAQVANANMRLNQGVKSLIDDFGDYSDILKEAGKEGNEWSEDNEDYAKGLKMVQKALADIGNVDLETIQSFGKEFVTENLPLIEKAAQGDVKAIDGLIKAIAKAQVQTMEAPIGFDEESLAQFETDKERLMAAIDDINFNDIQIGASFNEGDLSSLYSIFQEMINNGELTAENVNSALAGIGMTPIISGWVTADADSIDWAEAAASGQITTTDGQVVAVDQSDINNYSQTHGEIRIPIIKTEAGGNVAANKTTMANALASATFSGGTGRNLSQGNRNAGAKNKPKTGSCFVAGTPVFLNNNYKNIEDIQVGDIVLSYNEQKKKNVFSEVLQTMIHFVHEKIYSLFIKDEELKVTGNHKFLITHNNKQEWIQVSDLKIGDLVLLSDGTLQEINEITSEVKYETVYNFEVSNTHNYYVGKNKILAHNKGKGGGGSGGDKAPKKQKREELVKEKDRYHDIKEQISDLNTEMDRLDKIKDRVFGKAKLKYMDQEISKQEKQIGLTKEYIKEAKKYLVEDKKRLDEIEKGAKFVKDEATGEWMLTNYEEVLQNIVDAQNLAVEEINKAKEQYENGEISQEDLDAKQEVFDEAKKQFEENKKILKQYEDTFNTLQEQVQKLIDDEWKLYDLKLEKVKIEVEADLKLSDQSKKLLEWSFKYIGNDVDKVSDKVANLGQRLNLLGRDADTVRKGISGIFANHGIDLNWDSTTDVNQMVNDLRNRMGEFDYSELTDAEVDALYENMNKLMEVFDSAAELMKDTIDSFVDAIEKANDKMDREYDRFDRYKDTLNSYKDIVNLTGKNILNITNKNLEDLNDVIVANGKNKIASARVIYETAVAEYESGKEALNDALLSGDDQLIEQAQEAIDKLEDHMEDALDSYNEALNETLEDVQKAWEEALDAMEESYKNAFGNLGSDWYSEQFDRQKELSELYLPDYKKYHELNKSMNELQKNMANTNNQIVKGKARELLDDIAEKMRSGVKVSEYEAGIIERRVALLKAEDELLAARNAKSAVRMTRDTEGNFSYTYTADESQVEQAQQGYSDAYYNLRDYEVTGANDLQGQWLQVQAEFGERVRAIEEQYKDNESARLAALAELQKEYAQYASYFADQMNTVYKWEGKLRENDLAELQRIMGLKLDEWDTYITSWEDTLLNTVIPGYDTFDKLLNTWDKAMNTAVTSVNKAHEKYKQQVTSTMDVAGKAVDEFNKDFEEAMKQVSIDSWDTTVDIATLGVTTVGQLGDGINKVKEFTTNYLGKFSSIRGDNALTMTSIQGVIDKLSGMNDELSEAKTKSETLKNETSLNIANAMEAIASAFGAAESAAKNAGTAAKNALGDINAFDAKMKETVEVEVPGGPNAFMTRQSALKNGLKIVGVYDTGGYTGDWNSSEGRPAILHEKELVLNKEDTKNMLDAVGIIRSIVTNTGRSLGNMFNYNPLAFAGAGDTLQQQVHIDASFPNVTDHNEIELAINNLVNSASQYINRK